jgi:hypothetical protein
MATVHPVPWIAESPPSTAHEEECSASGLVELMLKDRARLDELLREGPRQAELIPRFLGIALAGFTLYGVAATVVLNAAATAPPWVPAARWAHHTAANLILAYDLGLIAAAGVCLPSFYFYGLLAGLRISMLQVTTQTVKCLATTAVVLVGILPLYVAVALGAIVFGAPSSWLHRTIDLGLLLPFIAGLWGVRSLYVSFMRLADTMRPDRREARACFLRRLTLAWAACYSVVTPVMIHALWRHFSG